MFNSNKHSFIEEDEFDNEDETIDDDFSEPYQDESYYDSDDIDYEDCDIEEDDFDDEYETSDDEYEESDDGNDSYSDKSIGELLGAFLIAKGAERKAKEAEINAMREAERIEKDREKRAWKRKHWKGLLTFYFVCFIALLVAFAYYEFSISIPIGYNDYDLIGQDYEYVVANLKDSGFTCVTEEATQDLSVYEIDNDNCVYEVIFGVFDSFDSDSKYPSNTPIKVKYHTLKTLTVPISSKEAKKSKYNDVLEQFENAGFVNIYVEIDYDIITGWINSDGDVESVTINGDKKFDEGSAYRADAEIVITYHALRKDKPE